MSSSLNQSRVRRATAVGAIALGLCAVTLPTEPSFAAFRVAVASAEVKHAAAPAQVLKVWGRRGGCWNCFGFRRFDRGFGFRRFDHRFGFRRFDHGFGFQRFDHRFGFRRFPFRRFGFRPFDRFEDRFETRFGFRDFR